MIVLYERRPSRPEMPPRQSQGRRILHVLATSVPHVNGYSMRSKYIVETQRKQGLSPVVVTSPFYPGDAALLEDATIEGVPYFRVCHPHDRRQWNRIEELPCRWIHRLRTSLPVLGHRLRGLRGNVRRSLARGFQMGLRHTQFWMELVRSCLPRRQQPVCDPQESVFLAIMAGAAAMLLKPLLGGIRRLVLRAVGACHLIVHLGNLLHGLEEVLLLRLFARELERLARRVRPHVMHAHTPYRCGQPAERVARRIGVPLVYEVRGLWEESGVAAGNFSMQDTKYAYWREQETAVMRRADAVVCICEGLRHEVAARGVEPTRIHIVPNAVAPEGFPARCGNDASSKIDSLRERLRGVTVGYVGSLRKLEGVDELVRGVARLVDEGEDVSLLVVGDGPTCEELQMLARDLGLADRAVFTGRVPHGEIASYYAMIDIFVVSRPALRVTKIVTPLKPLEAMATGRPTIVSDLPALREIVRDGVTGLLYRPGDVADLAAKCKRLIRNPALRQRLAEAGRSWVRRERTWTRSLRPLGPLYEKLSKGGAA
jgi:glycosyltransferase involved in cell wall biosynthesis